MRERDAVFCAPMDRPLTKYERVHILAMRVRQLNAGARTAVPWKEGDSTYEIAKRELESGQMPIRVRPADYSSSSSSVSSSVAAAPCSSCANARSS